MRSDNTILRTTTPRWRVAVLGGTSPARVHFGAAIRSAGGTVAIESDSAEGALEAIRKTRPDVALIAPAPVWHGGAVLLRLRDETRCPVVLIARGPSRRLLEEARLGGVMACLIEPVRTVQVAPTLDLAVARFQEVEDLRQALADRKVIEKAKGLLMARQRVTEEEAFRHLRRCAMDSQRPLAEIARSVLISEAVATPV